jgi:hypothetical protein
LAGGERITGRFVARVAALTGIIRAARPIATDLLRYRAVSRAASPTRHILNPGQARLGRIATVFDAAIHPITVTDARTDEHLLGATEQDIAIFVVQASALTRPEVGAQPIVT